VKIKIILKYTFIAYVNTLCWVKCIAQNFVINHNFETYTLCPSGGGDVDRSFNWYSSCGTVDYFHTCSTSGSTPGIPLNIAGYQFPFDGDAYAGLVTYSEYFLYREFLGTKLYQKLSVGTKYFVSAYISQGNSSTTYGASNNFSFRFTMDSVYINRYCPIDNFSHVRITNIISDSVNWVKVTGSFIADSAYQFLNIGNFYDDQNTDTLNIGQHPLMSINRAYYYIDNVCVTDDSLNCNVINSINSSNLERRLQIFPNPFNDILNFILDGDEIIELIIYDTFSSKVFYRKFNIDLIINTEKFSEGIYFYKFKTKSGLVKTGKLIKLNNSF